MTNNAYNIIRNTIKALRQENVEEMAKDAPNEKAVVHNRKIIKDLCVEVVEYQFERNIKNHRQNEKQV